jgi:hypothetical protein
MQQFESSLEHIQNSGNFMSVYVCRKAETYMKVEILGKKDY